jgi:hypothetical protein
VFGAPATTRPADPLEKSALLAGADAVLVGAGVALDRSTATLLSQQCTGVTTTVHELALHLKRRGKR